MAASDGMPKLLDGISHHHNFIVVLMPPHSSNCAFYGPVTPRHSIVDINLTLDPQGEDWAPATDQVHRRARLYRVLLPPDQLNPRGHYDAALSAMYERATRKKRQSPGGDSRLGSLPLSLPQPGAPQGPDSIYHTQFRSSKSYCKTCW